METKYVPSMVLLSVAVAIFASFVALNLAHSVSQARRRAKLAWLVCGSIAMGFGIWSMHFVGMLAFEMPGMEMAYDVRLMIISVIVAVAGSFLTLYIVSRPVVSTRSMLAGGVAMAGAISGMHYIGMYSMRMAARIEWNTYLVMLSIAIALVASFGAIWMSTRLKDKADHFVLLALASVLMGIAISGMHYTGMVAATFVHDSSLEIQESNLLVTSGLSVAVVATTMLILGIALMGSVGQRLMSLKSRHSEEVLSSSEEKFRLLIEAVKDYAIFMLDPHGRITTWNSGAERITGYAASEAIGQSFLMLHVKEARSSKGDQSNTAELMTARTSGHFEGEALHVRKDGTRFWANSVINALFDRDGQLTGFSKVTRDITQIREVEAQMRNINGQLEARVRDRTLALEAREAELKAAKDAAEVANATKSAFLANMSHEIRTPLGVILGFSELMLNEELSLSEKQNNVEIIKRNGKLLSGIINDILDLSKVEAGKLELDISDVSLVELVDDIASILSLEATEKGIAISVSADTLVPSVVRTDSLRLRQILFNLIGNAVKFTEKGSIDVRIKMIAVEGAEKLAFELRDSGAGISETQRLKLFTPFTQADVTTTRKYGGTGLGLALSKKLAKALGGDVILQSSRLGEGSTFVLHINHEPSLAAVKTLKPTSALQDSNSHPLATRPLGGFRILLVDDSPDNQALLKRILNFAGAEVECANNGLEGKEKALHSEYDRVLMDLQMPTMDGYEATRQLREKGYELPIIALTAHAMKEERLKCLNGGFSNYLTKPVDKGLLIETLLQPT